ncbi:hypothetical protein T484DRAFT_1778207 [Baffinella frigidus]|nr:hypothetical protein T484DRAFT_1778207 [Cryptophyta sp. CCMP2293]
MEEATAVIVALFVGEQEWVNFQQGARRLLKMRSLLALALIVAPAAAFSPASNMLLAADICAGSSRMMAVSEVSSSTGTGSTEFLPAQRYMGVNRFSTRGGDAGAKWEEQWTHREYSMLERPGFRVSSLLRRTDNGGAKYEDGEDYMAMTVFDTKDLLP